MHEAIASVFAYWQSHARCSRCFLGCSPYAQVSSAMVCEMWGGHDVAWCCGTLRFVCVCTGVLVMSLRELQTKVAREGATAAGFLKRRIDIENRVIDMTGTEVRAMAQLICIPSCRRL